MNRNRMLLTFLAIIFLLPSTLVSVLLTGLYVSAALTGGFGDSGPTRLPPQLLTATIAAGWFGILALWRLYLHFRTSAELPLRWRWEAAGLVLGTLASATLVVGLGFTEFPLVLFFGWPVIAATILGAMLLRARVAT